MSVSHKREHLRHRGRHRAARPKTFLTQDAAKKWASSNGVEKYSVEMLATAKAKKKYRVIEE